MLTTTKKIMGYEFGFVYGDINGANGLVVLTYPSLQNPEQMLKIIGFSEALSKAYIVAHEFTNICFLDETAIITDYADLSIAQLENLIIAATRAQEQTDWPLEEFGKETVAHVGQVIEDCRAEIYKRENKNKSKARASRTSKGYVYLVQSVTGSYKIGRTVDPSDRMKTFEVKLPFEVEYVCVIPTPDMYYLEKELHYQFANKRVNGEWFNLEPADVEYIKGLANETR